MEKKFKFIMFALLILGQIVSYRYARGLKINPDFLYLILVFVCVKSGFFKSIFIASTIGLITDFLSGNILGVFGFSRTIAGYLLNEVSMRIDLKNNMFVFLMIFISLSLSNLVANLFFYFIQGFPLDVAMVLYQPLFTGLLGLIIVISSTAKKYLDVY